MDTQELKTIINTAIDMRKAQKLYFRTRDVNILKRSKALEAKFDKMTQDFDKPNLFG